MMCKVEFSNVFEVYILCLVLQKWTTTKQSVMKLFRTMILSFNNETNTQEC
jgi:hypothetical protein